jgi:sodium/hydrogen antiporter
MLTLAGLAVLGAAILPRLVANRPLSFPIVYVLLGIVVFGAPLGLTPPDPLEHGYVAERLTELGVIVSLMGAGLKIDRPLGWRAWRGTWVLLGVSMPLTVALAALLGWWAVGLAPAAAVLFGAVIAPTDPVLASDVQVGPPGEEREDEVRFTLTSEAGLNDGLAFPFTNAAVAMAVAGAHPRGWVLEWLAVDVAYKIIVGIVAGVVIGRLLAGSVFGIGGSKGLGEYTEGFVALAATFLTYGVTELLNGYGFLAVFVGALMIRSYERSHSYHGVLHDFSEQTERLLTVGLLVLFGGAIAGGLFRALSWEAVVVAFVVVLVVRPLLGLFPSGVEDLSGRERAAIAFFGIRGIGSFYYLAYALQRATFPNAGEIWALTGLVVLISIVLHGIAASPVMRRIDASRSSGEPVG